MTEEFSDEALAEILGDDLDERTLLEQLAEEAAELSQAALKLIRAKGYSNNPTTLGYEEALENLVEEAMDVRNCLFVLGLAPDAGNSRKLARWFDRVEEANRVL